MHAQRRWLSPSRNDRRLVLASLAVGVLCSALSLPGYAARQGPSRQEPSRQEPYTRQEIDHKLDALRADILAHLPPQPSPDPNAVTRSQVDAQIAAVRRQIGLDEKESGVRTKSTDENVAALERDLKQTSADVSAIKARLPTIPAWVPIVISVLSAVLSAAVSIGVMWSNQAVTTAQRAEDRAWTLIQRWEALNDKIGNALGSLGQPQSLADQRRYNEVLEVGNLYDTIGRTARSGEANAGMIEAHGLKPAARLFWDAPTQARQALAQTPGGTVNLDAPVTTWTNIEPFAA